MNKVVILQGLPASGKTTYAKKLVQEEGYKRVNKDELREMIDCGKFSKSNEATVLEIRNAIIDLALTEGKSVVVDDTNFEQKHIDTIREIASLHDVEVEVEQVTARVTECIERDLKRAKPVGGDIILRMYNKYIQKKVPWNNDLPIAIVCDIDGTLATMDGRSAYDYSKVHTDIVNKPIRDILHKYVDTSRIIIMSGRDGDCVNETVDWLNNNEVPYNDIYMRSAGDTRSDFVVKSELYHKYIKDKYNVLFVLDDRNQVVDLWRSLGLTCLQVDYGNF